MTKPGTSEWYSSVLDALEEFVIVKGERSRLLWANRSFCDYYGMDNATLASLVDAEHSDPDDTLKYVRDDHEVWTSGKPLTVIEAVTRHDGEVRYYETTKRAVRENGETVLSVGISRPATDEDAEASASERTERKLSTDALRSFVTAFPGAVVVVDVNHDVVAASRDFVALLDVEPDIRGRDLKALVPMSEVAMQAILDAASGGAELTLEDVAVGASRHFDIRVAPWHLSGGQALGTMIRFSEVTELRASERHLMAERKALRSIIDVMNVGVVTLDEEGDIGIWNETATRLAGVQPIEGVGARFRMHDRSGQEIAERELPIARAFRGEHVEHEVFMLRDEAEKERWLTVSAARVNDAPGHAAVSVFTDITERILVEQELEEFAYVASHDLQEPLRMVKSYVDLLAEEYGERLDGEGAQYMHFIMDGANRMQALVRDLLIFSQVRKRELVFAQTDVAAAIETARMDLSGRIAESGGEVVVETPMPTLTADASQLVRLFENLFTNALKFSRPGVAPVVRVRAKRDGQSWHFEVEDNGIGIDPAYAVKVFEMFHRLNPVGTYPGTGIGLAVCKRIIARHAGSMGLRQKEDEGSIFWFCLPNKQVVSGELW